MSLFGSLMGDVEEDPIFGSHMRHVRQMNNMMNSLFSDPFGMLGGGPLALGGMGAMGGPMAIGGPHHGGSALMPFMPQMPPLNRLFSADLNGHMNGHMNAGHMNAGSSYSSSTVVMSSGLHGSPQVISSTSSMKIGPNGIKETRKTHQDSRTGTKKMSIGHHIGERAHVIEREQNVYSGDAEEHQEYINIEEEEAEDFDREFNVKAGSMNGRGSNRRALPPAPSMHPHAPLAILPPPAAHAGHTVHAPHAAHAGHAPHAAHAAHTAHAPHAAHAAHTAHAPHAHAAQRLSMADNTSPSDRRVRPSARRPLRTSAGPLSTSSGVREVYGGSRPQRQRGHRQNKHRHSPTEQ